ncbi:ATP10A [Bugula neritina]|uniref:Phospholipid-transporting ATPase n=1 Tax=Bugula neritina TaxID=10212 RepID=A0A7J7KCE4_BUGNE|nr:ATP10A [Bugula neritina]
MTTFTPVKNALKKITARIRRSFINEDSSGDGLPNGEESVLSQRTLASRYEAESPDELALVKAVCKYGCRLLSRTSQSVSVYLPSAGSSPIQYEVLAVLPFDSVRKCMSVVLADERSGEIVLYTKGADNIIFDKIKCKDNNQKELLKQTRIYVNHFAKDGLRTLCMAKKVLDREMFEGWYERYTNCDLEDREAVQFSLCNMIETEMELLGATANIKVWVLTGDKQETAINIGYACGLLPTDAAILTLNVPNADEVESALQGHLRGTLTRSGAASTASADTRPPHIPKCLIVDGKTLSHIFSGNLSKSFLRLADSCLAVLCCRTTPSQKAQIVELVKTKSKKLTLAIGDGANDVNMIRTANVGVGIEGLEGKQASMAADFSLGRFKHLVRLLFVHGHWSYDRLAIMTLYNFFKNSNLIFVLFWYQIFCMFSGQTHIDQVYLIVFHLLFTSVPPIIFAILDQDLPAHTLMAHPTLYQQGPENKLYHRYSYWIQILDSLYQSLAIFFISYLHYADADIGLWSFGTTQTVTLVFAQLIVLAFETRYWQWPFICSIVLSLVGFWVFLLILGTACLRCDPPSNPYWVMQTILSYADSWLCIMLGVIVAVVPRLVFLVFYNMLTSFESYAFFTSFYASICYNQPNIT